MAKRDFIVADLFCGAGGTSTGLLLAAAENDVPIDLLAVNHWPVAIKTHTKNHPRVRHMCADVEAIEPREAVPGGRLDLLIASPECTHHSTARGGRPVCPQRRASAWTVMRWVEHLYVETILIENVPEFRSWGPVGVNGRPLKSKRGEFYRGFLDALRRAGYEVQDGILNAADYGDPTTRKRLFIIARRGKKRITWPQPTHTNKANLFGLKKWRPARDVIDWSIKGKSIFGRKRPLSPATMARIMAGLERFGGPELQPFLVILRGTGTARDVDQPMPALTAGGNHVGLCEPFVLSQQSGGAPRAIGDPLPTVATDGAIGLVQPFLVPLYGEREGQEPRTHSVGEPLPTIPATGGGKFGVVEPFIFANRNNNTPRSVDAPVPTLCTGNHIAVVEPFILPQFSEGKPRSVEQPLGTITTTSRGVGLCEPHIVVYRNRGKSAARSIQEPVPTVTGRDRMALVMPVIDGHALDIRFRMLQPHELSAAMGFPAEYEFQGNREERVKQIGNAVAVNIAKALCSAIMSDRVEARPRRKVAAC